MVTSKSMIKLETILKSIPNQEIVESHLGQWEYPGRITRIPNNRITMQPDPRTGKPIEHILLIIGDQSGERQIGVLVDLICFFLMINQ